MSSYFDTLTGAVEKAGLHRPVLVVDRARLDRNLAIVRKAIQPYMALRLADKSIPVPALLERGFDAFDTRRVMSFHLPLTARLLERFPAVEVLMGKPMPVAAAADFANRHKAAGQVTWLVDSLARLADYRALAEQMAEQRAEQGGEQALRIAFEVNVGLGRGGFETMEDLQTALTHCGPLMVCGIMGYEAHVHALPKVLGGGRSAQDKAMARLEMFAACLGQHQRAIINTGGSSTLLGLPQTGAANDFTIGSLMLKPTDFDGAVNNAIEPAAFIVAPVLKTCPHQLPGHPRLTRVLQGAGVIRKRIAFAYGGKWMATPVQPQGLTASPFFAPSSNQHGFCLPNNASPPRHIVFRPTQSETVLQQFPALHVFDGSAIVDEWAPFPVC